jgi:acetyl-CoA acyltransferase
MSHSYIAGVGITPFGSLDRHDIRSLTSLATAEVYADTAIPCSDTDRIYFGNAGAGTLTGQEMIRGQVMLRGTQLAGIPLINVENACASGGSALFLAHEAIISGAIEVALVIGVEKMAVAEKQRAFQALWGSCDTFEIGQFPNDMAGCSVLMDRYAGVARHYLERAGAEVEDFARVAVKNRSNAKLNPIAQFKRSQTIEEVIGARVIAAPLTLPMCAPLTDGCVALLICSDEYLRSRGSTSAVRINACALACNAGDDVSPVETSTYEACERAGCDVTDADCIELHDAAAPAELLQYEEIGLCEPGGALELIRSGKTDLDGATPVNTSGGLLSRGHALGATGAAQVAELFFQLSGRAGKRQLDNPRLAMAVNGGGWLGNSYALAVTTICEKINLR